MKKLKELPKQDASGSKRANIEQSDWLGDWFVGYGKDTSCDFEGTWWDMICFARNVLASENTKVTAPEFYQPELANHNYAGEDKPYELEDWPSAQKSAVAFHRKR